MKELLAFLTSFFISYFTTPWVIRFAKKAGLLTDKRKRKHPAHTHKGILPRGGGISIFVAVTLSLILFVPLNQIILMIILASFLLLLIGLWDDKADVSPYLRFVLNIVVAAIATAGGIGIPYISNPFGEPIILSNYVLKLSFLPGKNILWLSDLLTIFWIVFMMNAINWSKGVDGQLPGFVGIAAIFLGILAYRFSAFEISAVYTALFAFIVSGAFFGFLPYNFYPQKILPGYSTGSLAGFYLAVLSLLSFTKIGTAVLVLAVPLIDAFYTLLRRILSKKSPFKADWGHFHHLLLEIGWGRRRIAVFYWIVTFILGCFTLFLRNSFEKIVAFLIFTFLMFLFIFFVKWVRDNLDMT